jgi:CHAD domain-containing protein
MAEVQRFRLREGTDADRLLSALEQRLGLQREPRQVVERIVYDTFDWRLLAASSVLEHRRSVTPRSSEGEGVLVWRSLATGEVLGQLAVDAVPRFAWELPDAPMIHRLARITEVRALVPLVTLRSQLDSRLLVDDEHKTQARVIVERSSVRGGTEVPATLEVVPVRGYDDEVRPVSALLDAQVALERQDDDPVLLALRAVGFAPGSYSSKLRLALDPASSAREAWVDVLRALFATMQANDAGLRDDVDSEFLHDFRVAVRRTRSVLADSSRVLDADLRAWARREFRWIGQVTSPARDADVFLLTLPQFEAALPPERRGDLKAFQSFLEDQQRAAHHALLEALDSPRYRELTERWRAALDTDAPRDAAPASDTPDADTPAAVVAGARIRRAHRRVIDHGRAISASSHPEELHELRKDAKRLRYLLECFGSLFTADDVGPVVRELKGLQDVLGEYQDTQVQAHALEHMGQTMIEQTGAPAATLLAMGSIVEQLEVRARDARSQFAGRFDRFNRKSIDRHVKAIAKAHLAVASRSAT